MKHTMKLRPKPLKMIREGEKTIELRLLDEKRQLIKVGDEIEFVNTSDEDDKLLVTVKEIYRFQSFEELYQNLPLLQCGYTMDNVAGAKPEDMEKYYPKDEQKLYGVVGFKIEKK